LPDQTDEITQFFSSLLVDHVQWKIAFWGIAAKVANIVGLYVDPPARAIVLSTDKRARSRRSSAPSRACQ
jgi:hypothetical protein